MNNFFSFRLFVVVSSFIAASNMQVVGVHNNKRWRRSQRQTAKVGGYAYQCAVGGGGGRR